MPSYLPIRVGSSLLTISVAGGAVGGTPSFPSDPTIVTPSDTVPNLAASPTILSAASGNWSSTGTWDLGRVPQAGDIVGIKTTHTVTYDVSSTAAITAVGIAGTLAFRTDISTKLTVQHLLVYGEPTMAAGTYGTLQIGTVASPIDAAVTAEVVFSDVAINTGTVGTPGPDPVQYGNGLLVWGKVTTHGAIRTPWLRTAAEPAAGNTSFTLASAVSGWRVGDLLVIPDSRQLAQGASENASGYAPRWETRTLASLASGNTVANLSSALTYAHTGGERGYTTEGTGAAAFYPHVANLTRNVTFRSANGAGTRGHTLFTRRAIVDVRYTRFTEMGRTSNADLNSATFSGSTLTAIGTNQVGRYAVHMHHLMGPVVNPANGYQWTFVGNAVDDPSPAPPSNALPASKWGFTIHGSHYGLIQSNVVHHTAGANFVTEDGSESFNVFEGNLSLSSIGDVSPRSTDGRSGAGFFLSGYNNYVRDNVSAGNAGKFSEIVSGSGFELFVPPNSTANFRNPLFPGADTESGTVGVDYALVNARLQPLLEFASNEAYGASAGGLTIWHLGSSGQDTPAIAASTVSNFVVWHAYEEAFFGYPTANLTFDGLVMRGDPANLTAFSANAGITWGDYWCGGTTVFRNADVRGCYRGFFNSSNIHGSLTFEDSYFRCYLTDITVSSPATPGTFSGSGDQTITVDNCVLAQWGAAGSFNKLAMNYSASGARTNLRVLQDVEVVDFDGTPGDNFRLYYTQQAASFVMPQSNSDPGVLLVACPEAGLTNAQAYVKYHSDGTLKSPAGSLSDPEGCAIAGAVAPGSATTRAGILGLLA